MPKASIEDVSNVIGKFYDVAYGAVGWDDALADLARLFHASRSWLFVSSENGIVGHSSLDDPGFHSAEARLTMMADPLLGLALSNPAGTFIRHSEMEDMAGFYRRPLFQDWLRPRDVWYGLQGHLKVEGGRRVFIDISHGKGQGDFSDEDKRLLAAIGPHIVRAADLSKAIAGAAGPRVADISEPSVVVDRTLRVLDFNAAAAMLFDGAANRSCERGHILDVSRPPLSSRVRELVADAVSPSGASGGGVTVAGEDPSGYGEERFVISVAPVPRPAYFGLPGDNAALIRLRPARGGGDDRLDELLMQLFGLPPSQARLARVLSGGESLRQAAAERGLSYGSARTYLDQIYRLTGTRRQSELVALLKAIEAGLRV